MLLGVLLHLYLAYLVYLAYLDFLWSDRGLDKMKQCGLLFRLAQITVIDVSISQWYLRCLVQNATSGLLTAAKQKAPLLAQRLPSMSILTPRFNYMFLKLLVTSYLHVWPVCSVDMMSLLLSVSFLWLFTLKGAICNSCFKIRWLDLPPIFLFLK